VTTCAACGQPNLDGQTATRGRRRTFCSRACRQRAYRRRRQGLPENALAAGARRGRLALAESYERACLDEAIAELEAARRMLANESDFCERVAVA
jgi:hypothetical protein